MTIMLSSTANINSAVFNVLGDGGNSTKIVLIAENKSPLSNQQMGRRYNLMKSHKNLQKMTKISFQDVFNVGLILMRTSKKKPVIPVVQTSSTRDV